MMTLSLASQSGAEKIGTGQVYYEHGLNRPGWGLHLSENPTVANDHRKNMGPLTVTLGGHDWRQVGRHEFRDEVGLTPAELLPDALQKALWAIAEIAPTEGDNMEEEVWYPMLRTLRAAYPDPKTTPEDDLQEAWKGEDAQEEVAPSELQPVLDAIYAEIESGAFTFARDNTVLYTVEAAVEPSLLLDWDATLPAQSEAVQTALMRHGLLDRIMDSIKAEGYAQGQEPKLGELTGEYLYGFLISAEPRSEGYGEGRLDQRAASQRLAAAGIPGLLSLDHYSRRDEGWRDGMPVTRNVTIFDPLLVSITHRNGEALTDAQGRDALEDVQMETGVMPDLSAYLIDTTAEESENLGNSL